MRSVQSCRVFARLLLRYWPSRTSYDPCIRKKAVHSAISRKYILATDITAVCFQFSDLSSDYKKYNCLPGIVPVFLFVVLLTLSFLWLLTYVTGNDRFSIINWYHSGGTWNLSCWERLRKLHTFTKRFLDHSNCYCILMLRNDVHYSRKL